MTPLTVIRIDTAEKESQGVGEFVEERIQPGLWENLGSAPWYP